ncbi:hypothetical protein FACS1894103_6050 [Campylobacterota bacterium]|nr:hypothetical protein FACS1894103_6050 [Campylobacterota bacterium]
MNRVVLGLAALIAAATFAFADGSADTGQRIYLKMLGDQTGLNGADFAAQHTIAEWNALFAGNGEKFVEATAAKFPKTKEYLSGDAFAKHLPHLSAFMTLYAKDSGNFPSCN